MHSAYTTEHRDNFIAFGRKIGRAIHSLNDKKQSIVALNGHIDSGKSLLALAIDSIYRPEKYKHGITESANADRQLNAKKFGTIPVIFDNLKYDIQPGHDAPQQLKEFFAQNANPSVIIISNLYMKNRDIYHYTEDELKNYGVDLHIEVHLEQIGRLNDKRVIDITATNSKLYQEVSNALTGFRLIL
jgi:ABC-type dipeptide/oligopeptide/nickel transport system ATPase component